MKKYTVIFEPGSENWSAYVPDLPGCVATGKDRTETESRIKSAIEFHIEGMLANGEKIPEPLIEAATVVIESK